MTNRSARMCYKGIRIRQTEGRYVRCQSIVNCDNIPADFSPYARPDHCSHRRRRTINIDKLNCLAVCAAFRSFAANIHNSLVAKVTKIVIVMLDGVNSTQRNRYNVSVEHYTSMFSRSLNPVQVFYV